MILMTGKYFAKLLRGLLILRSPKSALQSMLGIPKIDGASYAAIG